MARSPSTPRKSTPTTQAERTAKRLARQQKHLEKDLVNEMTAKVTPNAGRMVKYGDIKKLTPLTDTQRDLFDEWESDSAMAYLLHGSAGTGKSYMAIYFALKAVLEPDSIYKKIIIVRSTVQARQQGFLPGDIDEKMAPFEHPYVDICAELTNNKAAYEKLKETGKIEFMSTSFMRGETLRDAIVVFDETQNTTFQELSTVITRIGTGTKLFVLGDTKQDDLVQNKNDVSGFRDFINVTRLMEDFRSFKFTSDDIVRSPFVKSFIVACERLGL